MDTTKLNRELDKVKSKIFLTKNHAAFLGSIMSSMQFNWTDTISTANTDGVSININPVWYMALPVETREAVLCHELWHVARMHSIRLGTRSHKEWNWACDVRINNDLTYAGYTFVGTDPCLDVSLDKMYGRLLAEEEIYDLILKGDIPMPNGASWLAGDGGDLNKVPSDKQQTLVNTVIRATQCAKLSGKEAGSVPGDIQQMLNKFLTPIIPWEEVLMDFFTELVRANYTWAKPNRRFTDMYLPSRFVDKDLLGHLIYFLDVSCSVTDQDLKRFNSEVKYIQEVLNPQRLTLVQFDTEITAVKDFLQDESFDEIKIVGRGGTSFVPVRQYIIDNQPTAAIVFSDMECDPMEKMDSDIPIVWVIINNPSIKVPFGTEIHIKH